MLIKTIVIGSLTVLALAGGTSSCNPNPPTPVKQCDTEVIEPVISPDHHDSIEAVSRSECGHAPTTHRVSLYIEEQYPGGIWNPVESADLNLYTECDGIPLPGHDAGCTRLIPCLDGTYRTRASVHGDGDRGDGVVEPFAYDPPVSQPATIRCPA